MGGGAWSKDVYDRVTTSKVMQGTTFGYTMFARKRGVYKAHEDLNILKDGKAVTRESRDSDEHPESTPIVIGFDVTGSMGKNPAILQKALKGLFGMLVRKDIVSDPQIAIGAYGDTECDKVPFQFSQFESDNRIDDNLDNVFIEGGGGGNGGEMSCGLAWFVARHVVTDAWEKRGKKGYLFLIGDECSLDVARAETQWFLGEAEPFDLTPKIAFKEAQKQWNVFFLLVDNYVAKDQRSYEKYAKLIGEEHVIVLETTESAPAVIATIIGIEEHTVDDKTLPTDLAEAGFDGTVVQAAVAVTRELAKHNGAGGDVAVARIDDGYGDLAL